MSLSPRKNTDRHQRSAIMKCTDSIMNSKLLCLQMLVIGGGSVSVDFVIMITPGSKENTLLFFYSKKYSHSKLHNRINNQATDLQNYMYVTVHTPYYWRISWLKRGCLTASKLKKNLTNIFYFDFFVFYYSVVSPKENKTQRRQSKNRRVPRIYLVKEFAAILWLFL